MIKFLSLILTVVTMACASIVNAQIDTLAYYDFEGSIPFGWTVVDSTNNGFHWIHMYTGLNAVYNLESASDLNSTSSSNGWLMFHGAYYNTDTTNGMNEADPLVTMNSIITSSPIDFSSEPTVYISLQHYYRTLSNPIAGSLELGVSADNINWTIFDLHTGSDSPLNVQDGVETVSIDIGSVAALQETVWIRFHFRELNWHFWCIDDVLLTSEDVISGIEDHSLNDQSMIISPNPTSNFISIYDASNQDYTLHSMDGKLLFQGKAIDNTIDFQKYRNGIYFLRFVDSGQIVKIVKK